MRFPQGAIFVPFSFTPVGATPEALNMQQGKTRVHHSRLFPSQAECLPIPVQHNNSSCSSTPCSNLPRFKPVSLTHIKTGDNPQALSQPGGFWTAVVGGCYRIIGAVSAAGNQVMMTPQLPTDSPGMMVCPRCQQTVLTKVKFKVGLLVWLFFFLLLLWVPPPHTHTNIPIHTQKMHFKSHTFIHALSYGCTF